MHRITISESSDASQVLVAAGVGPKVRGWLFGIDGPALPGATIEEIDHLNTSGMIAVHDRLYRILSSASEPGASGDLMVYDATGVVAYHRIDGLADAHGLIWDGSHLIVPCSFTNEIVWLTPDGQRSRTWRAPGQGDAWHINGAFLRDGTLYASAFGTFEMHRGWAKTMNAPTGLVFGVETKRPILSGLTCPHDPTFVDGGWLVCDSRRSRLLFVDETSGTIRRDVDVGGWSRGVAVANDHIFVGVSGARHAAAIKEPARIVVLDRTDWRIVGKIDLPCEEISSLALVPREFMPALRRGFRTNDLRTGVQDRRDLLELAGARASTLDATPMEQLKRSREFLVRIGVRAPREVLGGSRFDARIALTNFGPRTIFSAAPFPVNVATIFEEVGGKPEAAEVRRDALPVPIAPGRTGKFTLSIQCPAKPGSYRVRFTLVQEWVRWFDGDRHWFARILSSNRRYVQMKVVPREPAALPGRPQAPIFAARGALLEAFITVTALVVAWASLVAGTRIASTALVEFGILNIIVAVSAAAILVRYAGALRGMIGATRFIDVWRPRSTVAGFAFVGLYALVNALLDVGFARHEPDPLSYWGIVATAVAALSITAAQSLRKPLLGENRGSPILPTMRDDRVYLACCYVTLFGQIAHAALTDWWLDTAIDVLVVALIVSRLSHVWRSSVAARA